MRHFLAWTLTLFAILVVLAFASLIVPKARGAELRADTALVFVVDCSGSMDAREVALEMDAYEQAIQSQDVLEAIREGDNRRVEVSFVEFQANRGKVIVPWTVVDGPDAAAKFAVRIANDGGCQFLGAGRSGGGFGDTPISEGLKAALGLLVAPLLPAERLVVDVSGDGVESGPNPSGTVGDPNFCNKFIAEAQTSVGSPTAWLQDCSDAALEVVRQAVISTGATINGLPMVADTSDPGLEDYYCGKPFTHAGAHVIGGPGSFCRPLNDIADMPLTLRQKIVEELY